VWQELLQNKYIRGKTLSQVQAKPIGSPFWKGIMGVNNDFFNRGSFIVGDGNSTRFWEDVSLGDTPLSEQYPSLYNITRSKNVLVTNVMSYAPLNI
jgi:hypothetical protein